MVGRHPGEPTEHNAENHHRYQRLKNRPGRTQDSLLITNEYVPSDEEIRTGLDSARFPSDPVAEICLVA